MNTKEQGKIEFLVYPEADHFVGVCLTLNIVEEADTYEEAKQSVEEAALLHLQLVRRDGLSDDLLNRPAPQDYWDKYKELSEKAVSSPSSVGKTGLIESPVTQYFTGYNTATLALV